MNNVLALPGHRLLDVDGVWIRLYPGTESVHVDLSCALVC